ncbi:universal stress protein [Methyloferula stellata]|uniref:universal stress protein n=1 Tax=Methyloferula stellata TaxID=876270 RepID=UPI000371E8EA|nr:universal stress protein [Methyloferula stellata]
MIKDIVVHLDGSSDDTIRIAHADRLAALFGAHLRGVYTHLLPEISMAMADFGEASAALSISQDEALSGGDQIEEALIRRFERLATPQAEVRRLDIVPDDLRAGFASEARTTDLVVGLRPYRPDGIERWPAVIEAALLGAGRGVFIVPDEVVRVNSSFDTIFIGWSNTRESARAVTEAMPFLEKARQVIVGMVDRKGPPEAEHEAPGADIARYLDRHSVKVELRHIQDWDSVADALLNETVRIGPDLVVLGAYGHSRLHEWIFGGVTRDFLTRCAVPILMAH